jgi:hypothetical protein
MEKSCFVIMPISDFEPYTIGHFKRVYEFLIKPACLQAGFTPVRADDILNTNYIALDIIKRIITSDIALCDLSSRNPNVFYELGIRQSFNLPVTLIRDTLTNRIFDIQGFRDIEYDEGLRIDNVQNTIDAIAETLVNTYDTKSQEINSLISLLGIQPASIASKVEISKDTEIILDSISSLGSRLLEVEKSLTVKSTATLETKDAVFTHESLDNLSVNDFIEHQKFGKGRILKLEGSAHNPIASVAFESGRDLKIMLNYAKIRKVSSE